jgi:hypothetical protein
MSTATKEGEVLEGRPSEKGKRTVRQVTTTVAMHWAAPYPPPEILNKYSEKDKTEIFKAVAEERKHRYKHCYGFRNLCPAIRE